LVERTVTSDVITKKPKVTEKISVVMNKDCNGKFEDLMEVASSAER